MNLRKTQCETSQNALTKEELRPFMTVAEACTYLDISKSSLYKYMHRRLIPYFKPNNKKAYFKPEDLDNWVFHNRTDSVEEIETRVDNYLDQIRTLN